MERLGGEVAYLAGNYELTLQSQWTHGIGLSTFGRHESEFPDARAGLYGLLKFHEITRDAEALRICLDWFRDRFAVGTTKVNEYRQFIESWPLTKVPISECEHHVALTHCSVPPRRQTRELSCAS